MLRGLHPDLADTVLSEAYGRVLARSFLPLPVRELVGVAVLVVLGLGGQLRAHLMGAHNAGASWDEIEEAVRIACDLGELDPDDALELVGELRDRD